MKCILIIFSNLHCGICLDKLIKIMYIEMVVAIFFSYCAAFLCSLDRGVIVEPLPPANYVRRPDVCYKFERKQKAANDPFQTDFGPTNTILHQVQPEKNSHSNRFKYAGRFARPI